MRQAIAAVPADARVQAALAELRLAFRIAVDVDGVSLEHLDDAETRRQRIGQGCRIHEVEIVRRRVILGKTTVRRARQQAHRQVEIGFEDVIDGADDKIHDRFGRVSNATAFAEFGVVFRQEGFVKMDDGVSLPRGFTEVCQY